MPPCPRGWCRWGTSARLRWRSKGNSALRGDILDIFPVNEENPVRVDFFGDGVEKIKPYNFITGERLPLVKSVTVVAATDVLIDPNEVKGIKDALYAELPAFKDAAAYERAQTIAGDIAREIGSGNELCGRGVPSAVLKNAANFRDFIGDALYIFDESKLISDKLDALYKEHEERFAMLRRGGEVFSFSKNQLTPKPSF